MVQHNRKTAAKAGPMIGPDRVGTLCVLAADGRLFGPFSTRSAAIYWCDSLDIPIFGTYDLLSPVDPSQRPPID